MNLKYNLINIVYLNKFYEKKIIYVIKNINDYYYNI